MNKILINMLSTADSTPGQGVGSAYLEQVNLVKNGASDIFDVRINSKDDADILHHHTINPNFYYRMFRTKGVNVSYVHFLPETLDGSIKLPSFAFKIFKKYVIAFYKKADYLVVVNPIFINPLVKYGIKKERIVYIPNFVSKEKFYKQTKKEINSTRKQYNIKNDAFVVLGVGQVQTRKGVIDFVEIAKKMPDVTFVWCGGFSFGKITDGYKELKEIYDNPPKNVIFTGIISRDEMNSMYNMSDVLFMPSYNELFPMSILEAVNTEKPILLRDLDLYEDILFKKYLKASNNNGFIKQIKELKNNKEVYKKATKDSIEISQFYSKENVLDQWIKFYTKIYNERK